MALYKKEYLERIIDEDETKKLNKKINRCRSFFRS